MGGCFYREWMRAEEKGYVRHFFRGGWRRATRWRAAQPKSCWMTLTADEERLMGRTTLWIAADRLPAQTRLDFGEKAAEEFAEDAATCFLASGHSVFDIPKSSAAARAGSGGGDEGERTHPCVASAGSGTRYILGVDPAGGGSGGDYGCIEVIDRRSGLQCAELYGHYIPREMAAPGGQAGAGNNFGLVVVERNNHGHAVLGDAGAVDCMSALARRYAGWVTTMFDASDDVGNVLARCWWPHAGAFHSRRLLGECRTFVRHRMDGLRREGSARRRDHGDGMALAVREAGYEVPRLHRSDVVASRRVRANRMAFPVR